MLWEGHSSLCSMVPSAAGSILQRALGGGRALSIHPLLGLEQGALVCQLTSFLDRGKQKNAISGIMANAWWLLAIVSLPPGAHGDTLTSPGVPSPSPTPPLLNGVGHSDL